MKDRRNALHIVVKDLDDQSDPVRSENKLFQWTNVDGVHLPLAQLPAASASPSTRAISKIVVPISHTHTQN